MQESAAGEMAWYICVVWGAAAAGSQWGQLVQRGEQLWLARAYGPIKRKSQERRCDESCMRVIGLCWCDELDSVGEADRLKRRLNGRIESLRTEPTQKSYGHNVVLLRTLALWRL